MRHIPRFMFAAVPRATIVVLVSRLGTMVNNCRPDNCRPLCFTGPYKHIVTSRTTRCIDWWRKRLLLLLTLRILPNYAFIPIFSPQGIKLLHYCVLRDEQTLWYRVVSSMMQKKKRDLQSEVSQAGSTGIPNITVPP